MIEHTVAGRSYRYYTQQEAVDQGLKFRSDWRDAESGDLALTDDGMVVPVISVMDALGGSRHNRSHIFKIPTGTFISTGKMTSDVRENRHSFTGKKRRLGDPKRRLTRKERTFVMEFMTDFDVVGAFKRATDRDPKKNSFRTEAYRFANRANVQMAIDEAVKLKLAGVGVDEEWFGTELKKIVSDSTRPIDKIRGLELGAKVLGLDKPPTTETTHGFIGIVKQDEIKGLHAERRELLSEGRNLGERPGGEAEVSSGDVPRHGVIREGDVPEGPVEEDPPVS